MNSPEPIDVLQGLLDKYCAPDEEPNLRDDEIDHYFYFDRIKEPEDLDAAWAVFAEGAEVRRRLAEVDAGCDTTPAFGYRVARQNDSITDDELVQLVRKHIEGYRPILWTDESWGAAVEVLAAPYEVQIAPESEEVPDAEENTLYELINSSLGDYLIDHLDLERQEYDLLYNWAIYLTKCDEVAAYLLWPCLEPNPDLAADAPDAGFALWRAGCRDRYWVKNNDGGSGVIYVRRSEPDVE